MAVEDKYTNTDAAADKKIGAAFSGNGVETFTALATFEVAAADDDGSVYRVFKSVNSNLIPVNIEILHDAITGGTDYDVGLYETNLGAVVDKDVLADGISLATATTGGTNNNKGLTSVDFANAEKTLGELSGQTVVSASYDIAITANTVGTAAGTVTVKATFVQG